MSIKFISPKKSVNSAFFKLPVPVEKMENFKLSLGNLYGKRDPKKDEEYHKNELQAFLKKIFDPAYLVQVKRPIDLAIYNGNDANAKPALSATTNLYHYGKTAVIEKTSKVPEPAEGPTQSNAECHPGAEGDRGGRRI